MATPERSKPAEDVPSDLLPLLRSSGVLTETQLSTIKARVLEGTYPFDARALAQRLVSERLLTEYQARRILSKRTRGLVIGRYVVMDRIGSGSMGRVYKAHHQLMDRAVALKIIAPELIANSRIVARFHREMRLVGRLDHPNVVRAFDADKLDDIFYIVMEYVPGKSLGQLFKSGGPLPVLDVVSYAAQAARGLAHAHSQGIVHRDVKPSNLLLDGSRVKVLDLGLGVLMEADEQSNFATADGIAVGTIDYMSPEQACGKEVDGRSDLFGLGCTMYHLISGRLPFPGATPIDRLGRRISGAAVPIVEVKPDVPRGLVSVLDRLIAGNPDERYQTADAAADELEAILKPRPSPRRSPKKAESRPDPGPEPAMRVQSLVQTQPEAAHSSLQDEDLQLPGWLSPLVQLAQRSPTAALLGCLAVLSAAFAAGFATAWLAF